MEALSEGGGNGVNDKFIVRNGEAWSPSIGASLSKSSRITSERE